MPEWEELRVARLGDQGTHADPSRRLPRGVRDATRPPTAWSCTGRATPPSTTRSSSTSSSRTRRRSLVKSKSMLTDECEMRPFLENRGIEIVETDLGERIQQLDDEPPSHIVVPAVHKLRGDVAEVFGRTIGTDPKNTDIALSGREPAQAHAAVLPEGAGRHDRRELRDRRDRQLRRLHQRGQRRPRRQPAEAAHRLDRHREAAAEDRAPRRLRAHAVAQRARLADHADHLALPRARGPAPRCTWCWSTTAAPSASAWRTSGIR